MSTSKETFLLRIKTNSHSDITLPTPSNATVKQLKQSIQTSLGHDTLGRYIRLIHSGRLLTPDSSPISKFKLNDGSVIHCVIAEAGVRGGQQALLSDSNNTRRRNGAGINADGTVRRRNDDSDSEEDLELGTERRGLDRLRSEGYSRSQISTMRIFFNSQIDAFIQRNELQPDDDDDEFDDDDLDPDLRARRRRMRMEELWMDAQGPNSEFRLNLNTSNPLMNRRRRYQAMMNQNNAARGPYGADPMFSGPRGTDRDFMWGFTLGYFVGFMVSCLLLYCPSRWKKNFKRNSHNIFLCRKR